MPESGSVSITEGKIFAPGESIDNAKLNEAAKPSARVDVGAITARELAEDALGSAQFKGRTIVQDRNDAHTQPGVFRSNDFVTGRFIDGSFDVGSTTFNSDTANFGAADVGRTIVATNGIRAGTIIESVAAPTSVILSQPTQVQYSDGVIDGTTLTSLLANFTVEDNGRTITGAGIQPGTTLTYVNATTATLSLAGTDGVGILFQIAGRAATAAFTILGRGIGWQLEVDAETGRGTIENYAGFFGGLLAIGDTQILEDGSLAMGSGLMRLVISKNGDALWGSGATSIGLSHDGKLFAGAADYANAPVRIAENGQITIVDSPTIIHNVTSGFFDPLVQPVLVSPAGGAITNPTNVTLDCVTRYRRIYYRAVGKDGVTNTDTSFVSASGNFTVKDVGKGIVGTGIPANAYIKTVTNSTTLVLSAATTATATSVEYYVVPTIEDTLYVDGTPIVLTGTTKVAARAYKSGEYSAVAAYLFTIDGTTVPNPTFTPAPGTYGGGTLNVALSCSLAGALLRYTVGDGTQAAPTTTTGLGPYGDGVTAPTVNVALTTGTTVIKVIAYKTGLTSSGVPSGSFVVTSGGGSKAATPTFSPDGGEFPAGVTVTIATTTAGAQLRYTTNGNVPTATTGNLIAGTSGPVTMPINRVKTLKAIAFKTGLLTSDVKSAVYNTLTE